MLASLLVLASTPFKDCVSPDHAHLSDLSLSPDPPVHGARVALQITTTPDIPITSGTVNVAVTVFGIPVPGTPTYDLCTEVGVSCPLVPGKPVAASVDYSVSPHVPAGIDATISLQACPPQPDPDPDPIPNQVKNIQLVPEEQEEELLFQMGKVSDDRFNLHQP